MDTIAMLITAAGSAVAGVLIAFRKREDTSIGELRERVGSLTDRVDQLEKDLETERNELVAAERTIFRLRRVLAANGIDEELVT